MLSNNILRQRLDALKNWLSQFGSYEDIVQIAGDASFRRYFRVRHAEQTFIAVDAPPELEDSHSFAAITRVFESMDLHVPHIFHVDFSLGFMLISDLGDQLYSRILNQDNADFLYTQAITALHRIQTCLKNTDADYSFPDFTHDLLMEELENFQRWYLETHLALTLTEQEKTLLMHVFSLLVESALKQPQVCVHRDYHSRNLLLLPNDEVGIIDYQDAVWGPVSYDLVSLIRDCYVDWPRDQVTHWMKQYYEEAKKGVLKNYSFDEFKRWFDWMGIQRHLKAIFIFARKWHRDKNPDYLKEIPRTLQYIMDVSQEYLELFEFRRFILGARAARPQ